MFKTLFSKMLVTYLSVILGLLLLLGITIGSMFQSQYIFEKEQELNRQAEQIADTVINRYMDDEKRAVAERELLTIASKYDAMIVLRFADDTYGKCVFIDEKSKDKWAGYAEVDISASAAEILSGASSGGLRENPFGDIVDIPVLTLVTPIEDETGNRVAALFLHTDMSHVNASIRQVWMDVVLYCCVAVILAMFAVSYITGKMAKPIVGMNSIVRRFSKGEFDLRAEVNGTDEVAQLAQSFNVMANELNALEGARRSFVANVSHELRSPLTSMRGFLEAMQDGTIPPEEHGKYLDIVVSENKRMIKMVNGLLDLARIESGEYAVKRGNIDINELIARTLITFEARIDTKKINVDLELGGERLFVEADADQIAHVLRNLIDNAIKFTDEGGRISLKTTAEKRLVKVFITDSGTGIAKEDIPHLFDRFYKAEKAHTPCNDSGTGLGLSIVKRIVDQHGQTISVTSELGRGTTFCFTLKRAGDSQGKGSRTLTV